LEPSFFSASQWPDDALFKIRPDAKSWWAMLMTSSDDGKSWFEPRRLPEGIIGAVKNKPVQLANGDILCGSSTEQEGWQVHFERTPDLGKTWEIVGPINQPDEIGAIQPGIFFIQVIACRQLDAPGRKKPLKPGLRTRARPGTK
jgi:hypothetical protein